MIYKVFNEKDEALWINSDYIIKIERSAKLPEYYIVHVNRRPYNNSNSIETIRVRPGCDELRMLLGVDEE